MASYFWFINFKNKCTMNIRKSLISVLAAALIVFFSGCGKENDTNTGTGRLVVKLTDAPFPFSSIESATVTITKVEVRKAGDCIKDSCQFIVVSDDTLTFNLLELRNGLVEELPGIDIPRGEYDMIRLYVDQAGLKVKDGDNFSVKVPSGRQTGIKVFINPGLVVEGGLTSELLLDFDLSQSFVLRGNPDRPSGIKGFIFKPVIRAVNNSIAGTLTGLVTDTLNVKIKEASIWVKQDTIVASTVADTLGHYAIIGIPAGTYSVYATKENYDTIKVEGVKITGGNRTMQNFVLTQE